MSCLYHSASDYFHLEVFFHDNLFSQFLYLHSIFLGYFTYYSDPVDLCYHHHHQHHHRHINHYHYNWHHYYLYRSWFRLPFALVVNVSSLHVVPTGCNWSCGDDKRTHAWPVCIGNDQSMVQHEGKNVETRYHCNLCCSIPFSGDYHDLKHGFSAHLTHRKSGSPMLNSITFEKIKLYVQPF